MEKMWNKMESVYQFLNIIQYKQFSNWSATAALVSRQLYKDGLELEKIGNLLTRSKDRILIQDNEIYKRVTVRLYNKGVLLRNEAKGEDIGTKSQYKVKAGQFLLAKIDARNGAFGIVPNELEGAVVTQDFLAYDINTSKILPAFFVLITATEQFQKLCQMASSGTTGRQRVDENAFLDFEIPVPPIKKQRKLVGSYEEKMNQAKILDESTKKLKLEMEKYFYNTLGLEKKTTNYEKGKLHVTSFKSVMIWGVDKILGSANYTSSKFYTTNLELSPQLFLDAFRGKSPKYDSNSSKIILNQKCNRWNFIDFKHAKTVKEDWVSKIDKEKFTKSGDIIINSTGEGTIGRATFITDDYAGYLYDSHILLLRLNSKNISAKFLTYLLNSSYGQMQIDNLKSAKSTKQTELGIKNLLKIYFPVPNIEEQVEIVEYIDKIRYKINVNKRNAENYRSLALKQFEKAIFKTTEN